MTFIRPLTQQLVIHNIIAGNITRLGDFLEVFVELFPQYSYRTDRLAETANNPANMNPLFVEHQWLIEVHGNPAAMTTFKYLPQRNLGIGVHLAIRPKFRKFTYKNYNRLSEIIIEETRKQISKDAEALGHSIPLGYVIEVVEPKLISRYSEYGFLPFDIPYHEPTISQKNKAFVNFEEQNDHLEFHPAVLGLIPTQNQIIDIKDPVLLENAINGFLIDYYELDENHWVVKQARGAVDKLKTS